tara:strand:- start:634 stop:1161 length:528 start_codon:yes stop_codon:yes gene_type:complete
MFVSEIIPNLWVCDYDILETTYFNTRNIGLYIHINSFKNNINLNQNYTQKHIEIKIKDINNTMYHSSNAMIQKQIMRYSKEFGDYILKHVTLIQNTLEHIRGVVIYSKHGIQKAATMVAGFLIIKCNIDTQTSINIMNSKEPLFFKNIENLQENKYNNINYPMYEHTLKYIETFV